MVGNVTDSGYKSLREYSSDEELAQVKLFGGYPDCLLNIAAAFSCIFIIIGIPGNLVTIAALANYRKIRNATAIFIINLSVADLLYSAIVLPIAVDQFLKESWTTGIAMCRWFPILNYGLTAASVFSVVAITINRYVLVAHPIQYPKLYQTRNLAIMIICIWLGAFGMLIPIVFEKWGQFSLDPNVGFCTVTPDKYGRSPKVYIILMGFIFPTFCIVLCYSRIMYLVRKSIKKSKSTDAPIASNLKSDSSQTEESTAKKSNSEDDSELESTTTRFKNGFKSTFRKRQRPRKLSNCPTRRDKRLRSMIMAVIITFFVCHFPIMLSKAVHSDSVYGPYGNIMGYLFVYISGCLNPIIYVVLSKEYRKAYRHLFKRFKCHFDINSTKLGFCMRFRSNCMFFGDSDAQIVTK